jgi:hypothetical protein
VRQDRDLTRDQRGSRITRFVTQFLLTVAGESQDGDVGRVRRLFELADDFADVRVTARQINDHEKRLGLLGLCDETGRLGIRENPVTEVLESINQLVAQQEILVEDQRKRFSHGSSLREALGKSKSFQVPRLNLSGGSHGVWR